jgi:hypothetical protein
VERMKCIQSHQCVTEHAFLSCGRGGSLSGDSYNELVYRPTSWSVADRDRLRIEQDEGNKLLSAGEVKAALEKYHSKPACLFLGMRQSNMSSFVRAYNDI